MKIIKYLFLIAVLLFVGLTVFISTQSASFNISKSKIIKTPRSEIYNYVNDFKNWNNIISIRDTLQKPIFTQKTKTKAATITFNDFESRSIYTTTSTLQNVRINQSKIYNGAKSKINWSFKDTLGGTKITLKNEGFVDFETKVRAFFSGGIASKIGNELELNLENLNKKLHFELDSYEIKINGIVTQDSIFCVKRTISCLEKDVLKNSEILILQIQKYCTQKNATQTEKPFINYRKSSTNSEIINITVYAPVTDSVFTSPKGVFQFEKTKQISGLKGTLKGNYSHISKLWTALNDEISKNNINTEIGSYTIIYKVGISDTKNQSNYITEIIIPIKQKPKYIRIKRPEGDTTREPGDSNPTNENIVPVAESEVKN